MSCYLQEEFKRMYINKVKSSAEDILTDLKKDAERSQLEVDIYIRHVINEMSRRLGKDELP